MKFTFHYVSIKSATQNGEVDSTNRFTFHYVSIKSKVIAHKELSPFYLHSTMYLLNLFEEGNGRVRCMYLHSTMYLLNPKSDNKVNLFSSIFTFHYVSIKS